MKHSVPALWRTATLTVALTVGVPADTATGQEKPPLRTEVHLVAPQFTDIFSDTEIAEIQTSTGRALAEAIVSRFGFLNAAADMTAEYTLVVELDELRRSPQNLPGELGAWVSLSGPSGALADDFLWIRLVEGGERHEGMGATPAAVSRFFETHLGGADYTELLERAVRRIPLTSDGASIILGELPTRMVGWLLPFRLSEVCLGRNDKLLIHAIVPNPINPETVRLYRATVLAELARGQAPPEYERFVGRIFSEADEHSDAFEELIVAIAAKEDRIQAVFVTDYSVTGRTCASAASSPTAISSSLRGGN